MKTTGRLKITIAALIIVFIFAACPLPSPVGTEIKSIGWHINNFDTTFFSSPDESDSASIMFFVYFETSDLVASDIASVRIKPPGVDWSWVYDDPTKIAERYNTENYSFRPWISSRRYADNGSVLPIGRYNFTVTYSNGAVVESSLLVPAPGSKETGSTLFVYTEDFAEASNPPANYAPFLRRASIISADYDRSASDLTIEFSVDDDKIYNCGVWFYDTSRSYVGETRWYRDFETGEVSSWLNNDSGEFHIDGETNTIALQVSDIQFKEGKEMSDAYSFHLVLTDGHQYASDPNVIGYDTKSVSKKLFF